MAHNKKIKYYYVRRPNSNASKGYRGDPFACIASEVVDVNGVKDLHFTLSVVSNRDKFVKQRAREIALGRLESGRRFVLNDVGTLKFSQLIVQMMNELMHVQSQSVPSSVKRAARAWLKDHDNRLTERAKLSGC